MTTLAEEPKTKPGSGSADQSGYCPGCPRCQDSSAPLCQQKHEKYGGLHPVCKHCSHCVLRGRHLDDGSDLDNHPGISKAFGPGQISRN